MLECGGFEKGRTEKNSFNQQIKFNPKLSGEDDTAGVVKMMDI